MIRVPRSQWPNVGRDTPPIDVWRDGDFLALAYAVPEHPAHLRLTVVRAAGVGLDGCGRVIYRDGITWDDLMGVKRDCGYGDRWAVEVFPPDSHVVNVANMRHLWLLPGAPTYAWRGDGRPTSC